MKKFKKGERFKLYTNFLSKNQAVTFKAFYSYAVDAGIPEITARRDLKILENFHYISCEMGLIKYNPLKAQETARVEKTLQNSPEKNKIARTAQSLISGKELFVGPGTTCEAFVRNITAPINYLYTNGFEIAKIAENNENIERVIIIGGKLRPQSGAMCGPIAIKTVEDLQFLQSFITVTNISKNLDLFNNNEDEAFFTTKVVENSNQTICLVDTSKLKEDSYGNKICNAISVDKFVFEVEPSLIWKERFEINSEIKW